MVFFEKSQPAPDCLEKEKSKANGDYKCGNVLETLKNDFKNKCYICESKEPTSINVEHFKPHKGEIHLKFDWNNLFWVCGHCNNTKLAAYNNILNCTNADDDIENRLKYTLKPFPFEKVQIEALDTDSKTLETKDLLLAVYNGTTPLKTIESANLRNAILNEIKEFQGLLFEYFKTQAEDDKRFLLTKIKTHLSKASNFTAFKRWIILENDILRQHFQQYFD